MTFCSQSSGLGETDMDEGISEKAVRSKYGELLFTQLMTLLTSSQQLWKLESTCVNRFKQQPDKKHKESWKYSNTSYVLSGVCFRAD